MNFLQIFIKYFKSNIDARTTAYRSNVIHFSIYIVMVQFAHQWNFIKFYYIVYSTGLLNFAILKKKENSSSWKLAGNKSGKCTVASQLLIFIATQFFRFVIIEDTAHPVKYLWGLILAINRVWIDASGGSSVHLRLVSQAGEGFVRKLQRRVAERKVGQSRSRGSGNANKRFYSPSSPPALRRDEALIMKSGVQSAAEGYTVNPKAVYFRPRRLRLNLLGSFIFRPALNSTPILG